MDGTYSVGVEKGKSNVVGSTFVPKGLNDGSLARSAWKRGEAVPPRRVRSDLLPVFEEVAA
jgi:hypothetical protein